MLEPQNGFVGRNNWDLQEPIQMQRLKVSSVRHVQHQLVLRSNSFTGGIPKRRKHAQGCESPNAETWWWWGCLQTSATMELVGFGEFCSLTLHASFNLKPTCETCWNWPGITSWSFKKYHGAAFSKYSTSGWDSSKRNPPPQNKNSNPTSLACWSFPLHLQWESSLQVLALSWDATPLPPACDHQDYMLRSRAKTAGFPRSNSNMATENGPFEDVHSPKLT